MLEETATTIVNVQEVGSIFHCRLLMLVVSQRWQSP